MQDQIKNWTDANQKAISSLQQLAEINAAMMNALVRQQVSLVEIYAEGGTKHLEAISNVKKVDEVVKLNSDAVQELHQKVMGNVRATFDILADNREKLIAWMESGVKEIEASNPLKLVKNVA